MEVRQILRFRGSHTAVLADVAQLLELLESLPTAELVDELANGQTEEIRTWPSYQQRLLRFNGCEVTITQVYDLVFRPIWEARGNVVSINTLAEVFSKSDNPRQRVAETIHRLRRLLKDIPSIAIATAGDGYYLQVAT